MKEIFDGRCARCGNQFISCSNNLYVCMSCGMKHSIEYLMLNADYDEILEHLHYHGKVSLEKCPYDVQNAVELKRKGNYVGAQKIYIDIYKKTGILYVDMALWWYKVLVSAGSLARALNLLSYTLRPLRATASAYPPEQILHFYELVYRIEGIGRTNVEEYIKSISGNPDYIFDKDKIDVLCRSKRYIPVIEDLLKHDIHLSRTIFKMCTNYEQDVPW